MSGKFDAILGEYRENDIQDLSAYITEETDPVFNAWLLSTPPVYVETDPVFSSWMSNSILNHAYDIKSPVDGSEVIRVSERYLSSPSDINVLDWSTGQVVINDVIGAGYILNVHAQNDNPFLAGFYNDTWSSTVPVFEYFGWNYGGFTMGTNGGELILSISSWSGRNLVITAAGNTQINANIETPNMPTSDPMDGTGTLWYDTSTNIVYRGT